jgi:hypothetical protein
MLLRMAPGVFVEAAEFGSDLVRVGVAEPVEDVLGTVPRLPCCGQAASGSMGIPEMAERGGPGVLLARVVEQLGRTLVAGDGLVEGAEAVVDKPESVQGSGLADVVTQFFLQA